MIDNDFNKTQYEEHAQSYTASNTDGRIGGGTPAERTQLLLKYLPKGRHIFEVGSAGGQDARALQQAGYEVTPTDFVEPFVENLREKGFDARLFDAKKDEFPAMDALYANAVFVHFTPSELQDCLKRAKPKLTNEKIVFMSLIKGEGQERSGRARGIERDFQYYTLESLEKILKDAGFEIVFSREVDEKWIQVVGTLK